MANTFMAPAATDSGAINYHSQVYGMALGLGQLKSDLVLAKLVTNYSAEARNQGSRFAQNVRVPVTGAVAATTKTPGTDVTPSAATSGKADIAINTHKTWDILIEDNGGLQAQADVYAKYMKDGANRISEAVESAIAALYTSAITTVGSAGGNASQALMASVRGTARSATCKFDMSQPAYMVWGVDAEADLLNVAAFVQAYSVADNGDALSNAYLGNKFGFKQYTSNLIAAVAGTPGAEHNLAFQSDAIGIAFVDLNLAAAPGQGANVSVVVQDLTDDEGTPVYSLRSLMSYDQKARGTLLSVDTIFGVGVVRAEHLIDVIS
jgi:hypothetical protein